MQTFFPTLLEQDETGMFVAEIVGNGINGQGDTEFDALTDAAVSLQEIIWYAVSHDEPVPAPAKPSSAEAARGRIALVQATLSAANDVVAA